MSGKIQSLGWDKVEDFGENTTYRTPVPGGWFVHFYTGEHFTAIFYPDPEHAWDGKSLSITPNAVPVFAEIDRQIEGEG